MHVWRSDVVGSLLRPYLVQKHRVHLESGKLQDAALKRIEYRSVDESVPHPEAPGLEVITNGVPVDVKVAVA